MRFTYHHYILASLCTLPALSMAQIKPDATQPIPTQPAQNDAAKAIQPTSPQACVGLVSNNERLACFDAIFTAASNPTVAATSEAAKTDTAPAETVQSIAPLSAVPKKVSYLDQRWELSPESKLGTWQIRAYQPVYALPLFWTSDKNTLPSSPNPDNTVTTPQTIQAFESKIQFSFKTKAVQNIFGDNGDVWLGFTQSSRWQLYNGDRSRPFRETNYEPEASLIFRTHYQLFGFDGKLLGLTLNHQSNGRSNPLSRSWNRAMLNLGFEKDNFTLMLRPWYRFEEKKDDNNPDIADYVGRGDLNAHYKLDDQDFNLMLRGSLKGGDNNRGAIQFDWAFPIDKSLRGYLQLFHGYGESLIDYNHKATYVGLGVSLINWF